MSGHNKWQQIKHKKGVADQKKGQLFSKLAKKISIAAREGADPESNYRLQSAINEAKAANMPRENIERAIKKAGSKDVLDLKEFYVQAIGPESTAIVIETITNNTNRTVNEIKNILSKNGAKLAEPGSLDWVFDKKGLIGVAVPNNESGGNQALTEETELGIIEAGAEDIIKNEEGFLVIAPPDMTGSVKKFLDDSGLSTEYTQVGFIPKSTLAITDNAARQRLNKLLEELGGHDDTENVYSNAE